VGLRKELEVWYLIGSLKVLNLAKNGRFKELLFLGLKIRGLNSLINQRKNWT